VPANGTIHLAVTGHGGVPATNVAAVVLNVTVTAPTRSGYITVYPDGTTRPRTSNLNYLPHQSIPNLVLAPVGANGKVDLYNSSTGTTHLVADVFGYILGGSLPTGGPSATTPCGFGGTGAYSHVVWIWMENKGYGSVIGSSAAPYENAIATTCGLADNYATITHPSLPNYIAATGGSTFGITDDKGPSVHPVASESIFSQVAAAGLTWKGYDESMPAPCTLTNSGLYAVRHNPATYFTGIRTACKNQDVPLEGNLTADIGSGSLPSFSFVTPNKCNDTHDCDVATGDAWLSTWVSAILDGPNYRAGNTLVVITWDEGGGADGRIPTIVIAPTVPSGTVASTASTHYSLLRTTEDLLGLPALGNAQAATSLASAFHL
jgi:hypothetical protein